MNIFDASQSLVSWFNNNDSFVVKEHYSSITKKDSLLEVEEAAIRCALQALETAGMINHYDFPDKTIWVLKQPLVLYPQQVEISGVTALNMSNLINNFFSLENDESNKCDALNINEEDILKIMQICSYLAENFQEQSELTKKLESGNKNKKQ